MVGEIHVPDVPNSPTVKAENSASCSTSPARQCGLSVPNLPTATAENLAHNSASWAKQCDRTRSPVGVSRKRELFNEWPETFGIFGRLHRKSGVWRRLPELQKPTIGGLFRDGVRPNRDRPECLAGDAVLIAPVSTPIPC